MADVFKTKEKIMEEKTYTKNDIMGALNKIKAPIDKDTEEMEAEIFRSFYLGAEILSEAILDGLGEREVRNKKIFHAITSMVEDLTSRAEKAESQLRNAKGL